MQRVLFKCWQRRTAAHRIALLLSKGSGVLTRDTGVGTHVAVTQNGISYHVLS